MPTPINGSCNNCGHPIDPASELCVHCGRGVVYHNGRPVYATDFTPDFSDGTDAECAEELVKAAG